MDKRKPFLDRMGLQRLEIRDGDFSRVKQRKGGSYEIE